ncbi:MAG: cytochrome c1 protein, partial [Burkholderiales bacterium]
MSLRSTLRSLSSGFGLACLLLGATPSHALPSYARQTGQDCASCHVGSFGPQLTPYGIKFKIGGYTDSDGKDGHVPVSGMAVAS